MSKLKQCNKNKQRRLDYISNEARRTLVRLVFTERMSIRRASKLLLINYTTAKSLITKYTKEGTVDRVNKV